nr:MAG TPA: hypothetical protein [Caudoviricetes sp.]DAI88746.1 MAG TPA: hypothetical protein [Caudoviricetes sp.]
MRYNRRRASASGLLLSPLQPPRPPETCAHALKVSYPAPAQTVRMPGSTPGGGL